MTLFSLARSVTDRRADGGLLDLQQSIMSRSLKTFSTSADVCEALYYQCNPCDLWLKISCLFVSFRGSTQASNSVVKNSAVRLLLFVGGQHVRKRHAAHQIADPFV